MSLRERQTFGGRLTSERERAGLSQAQVAEAAGLDASTISKLEAGTRVPSPDTVARLVAALTLDAEAGGGLYVAARLLPPGDWVWLAGWCIRPTHEQATTEHTDQEAPPHAV